MWAWFPHRSPSLAVSRGWPGRAVGEVLGDQSQVCAGGQAEVQLVGNLRKIDHLSRFGACGVDPDPDDSCSHDRHVGAAGRVHNQVYRYEI